MRSKANRQVNVPMPRDSDLEKFYEDEAASQGVKLPTHIYQLLKDRYEALRGRGQGIWFPRGVQVSLQQEQPKILNGKAGIALKAFGGEDDDEDSPTEKMHAMSSTSA